MANILGIGIATLDIVNVVDGYPAEDAEVRAAAQRVSRGGNATNTLVILSQLRHNCTWGGVWVEEDSDAEIILTDLRRHQINIDACHIELRGKMPTSYITLNQRNGSRTIVHHRQLPEYSFSDFQHIKLKTFNWLHFEGRNVSETHKMLAWAKQHVPLIPISIEIEKDREGIETLFPNADVLLFSRHYAEKQGIHDPQAFLRSIRPLNPHAHLFCAWGDQGAYALTKTQTYLHEPAFPILQVVDTLGAGDVFNAAVIDGLVRHQCIEDVLHNACRLAGLKCGQIGLTI